MTARVTTAQPGPHNQTGRSSGLTRPAHLPTPATEEHIPRIEQARRRCCARQA